ncbi:MAG: hypothetical protein V4857_14370 [Pseudomonadota bacterium]
MDASTMEIKVKVVSEYGKQRVRPVCAKAELFCSIAGSKTLTDSQIQDIKALGYAVVQEAQTL